MRGQLTGISRGLVGSTEVPIEFVNDIYRSVCGYLSKGHFRTQPLKMEARDLSGQN